MMGFAYNPQEKTLEALAYCHLHSVQLVFQPGCVLYKLPGEHTYRLASDIVDVVEQLKARHHELSS